MFASMWICLPQEGLPSIRDEIEAAWLEGRGQLTDEQVARKYLYYYKVKQSGEKLLKVGALVEWELSVSPDQGGDLSEQADLIRS